MSETDTLRMLGATVAVLIAGMAGVMVAAVRVPADILTRERKPRGARAVVLNVAGWLLVAAGLGMLVLPGPGVLVLLLGVALADFPGKHRVMRWLMTRGAVLGPVNALRRKFGREALEEPRAGYGKLA